VHVLLADQHRSSASQANHNFGVVSGHAVRKHLARARGLDARRVNEVLQTDWDAVEGTPPLAPLNLALGLSSFLHSGFRGDRDECVDPWIQPLDSL
jgi:hypothetical protein